MLATLGLTMLIPALLDAVVGNEDWEVFLAGAFLTGFVGAGLVLSSRGGQRAINQRQAFLLTTSSWLVLPAFGALPFAFSALDLSYGDSFFEAMSGLTTTGSTVIVGLDRAPPGILIWRAILQWLGGIGIVVTAIAILPMLRIGGMQLFRMESADQTEKVLPRAAQISGVIGAIYLGLTALCVLAYWLAGMNGFEAVAHAMTTIATGGFSTSDASFGHFDSVWIDYSAAVFMVIGSLPFLLYFQPLRGRPLALWRDSQVRGFLVLLFAALGMIIGYRVLSGQGAFDQVLRETVFNVTSILTGTGYSTADYGDWGDFVVVVFLFIMFVGGCAGSTSCGIKIFRFQVLLATLRVQLALLLRPHGVTIARFNREPIPEPVMHAVTSFFFVFAASFAVLAVGLSAQGLDTMTAISGAATALANVGPGLGEVIGPAGSFAELPQSAKWTLAFGMLLGRLELFTVLVLFTPAFWRA